MREVLASKLGPATGTPDRGLQSHSSAPQAKGRDSTSKQVTVTPSMSSNESFINHTIIRRYIVSATESLISIKWATRKNTSKSMYDLCSVVEVHRRFEVTCRLHLLGRKPSKKPAITRRPETWVFIREGILWLTQYLIAFEQNTIHVLQLLGYECLHRISWCNLMEVDPLPKWTAPSEYSSAVFTNLV
jgi:hypothetical protein